MNKLLLTALTTLTLGLAAAQMTRAGTVITNQAQVTIQTLSGQPLPPVLSPVVTISVLPLPGFDTVYPDGQDGPQIGNSATAAVPAGYEATVAPGGELITAYTLVNTGNTVQTVQLRADLTGPSSGHTAEYYLDADGNGQLSPAEQAAGPVQQVTLNLDDPSTPADEGLTRFLQVIRTPATAAPGAVFAASPAATGQVLRTEDRTVVTVQESATILGLQFSRAVVATRTTCSVTVTPNGTDAAPGQLQVAAPGSGATFAYALRNGGPTETVTLNAAATGPSPAPATQVVIDRNANGQVDPDEPPVTQATVAPGQTVPVLVTVAPVRSAGDVLVNLTAGCADGTVDRDNVALLRVGQLNLMKRVDRAVATVGDRLGFTVTLDNQFGAALQGVEVTDTPHEGLAYLPGSSALNGQPLADPEQRGGHLIWTLPSLAGGAQATLTYATRVTPAAGSEVRNTVTAQARTAAGSATATATAQALATARIQGPLGFAPLGDLLGRVYVDRNANQVYDPGDTPVPAARILLAGGREVRTDPQGRYSFPNVPLGQHALRLDPASVPFPPARTPQDGGLPGTRTVSVRGLTTIDFPLQAPAGPVTATRQVLTFGPVTVTKTVTPHPGEVIVVIDLHNTGPALDATLSDPLPDHAALTSGQPTWRGTLPTGHTTLTYTFTWTGTPGDLTLPSFTWRN